MHRDLPQDSAFLRPTGDSSFVLNIYVQPKASANRIAGLHADAIKICLTAPPVDGKANKAIVAFLAKIFGLSKSAISIDSGQHSRSKRLLITGVSPGAAKEKLSKILSAADR